MLTCNSCGGTYNPTLADGSQYFHQCPPLSVAELRARVDEFRATVTPAQRDALDAARAADQQTPRPAGVPTRVDDELARWRLERPDARDENVTGRVDDQRRPIIKAAGKGTTTIAAPTVVR